MAKSKKVRKHYELVQQMQSASKALTKLQKKVDKSEADLSPQERDEYYALIHKKELEKVGE